MTHFDKKLLNGFRILVVEDDPDLRESVCEILKLFGADILQAENGKKGFDLVQNESLDLILSDVRMPGGDGISFLENVRSRNADSPPFFFISGYSDLTEAVALSKGAQAMFHKPYDAFGLAQAIADQLKKSASGLKWNAICYEFLPE